MANVMHGKASGKMIIFLLLQTVLVLLAARVINFYHNQLSISDVLITIIALLNFSVCIFAVRGTLTSQYLDQEIKAQKESLRAMDEALKEIKIERHDFVNHLQSIHGYLLVGEHEEALNYLKEVGADCRFNSQILSIPHPSLRAFLLSKKSKADAEGIEFKLDVESKLDYFNMRPSDITVIFGNLLDNAIDSVRSAESKTRKITFKIYETRDLYHFEVQDSGPPIDSHIVDRIFEPGYSSKGSDRGYGLALAQKVMGKYGGSIVYDSNPKCFTVSLPESGKKT